MGKNIFSRIFKLNNLVRFDLLEDQIFTKNYRDIMRHANKDNAIVNQLPDDEKYYVYSWQMISEVEELNFEGSSDLGEGTIRFKKATANIEYTKKKTKDENDNFLPKEDRLNVTDIEAIFFEKNETVYVLILTSNETHVQRVNLLIGLENILDDDPEYNLDSSMFNWLFYLFREKDGIITDGVTIKNISGFVGNVVDSHSVVTGTSNYATELIVTKAFISNCGDLKKINFLIEDPNVELTCTIDEDSTAVINCNRSHKRALLDTLDKPTFLLLYLYSSLLLNLKRLYRINSDGFITEKNPEFLKDVGLEVIKSIVEKNSISREDIKKIYIELEKELEKELIESAL